jgi:ribosomal protein L21E
MNKIIKDYYEEYNYTSTDKLYKIMKKDGIDVSKDQIKVFIDSQTEQQLTKQTKEDKKKYGHIVSFNPDTNYQIDIFDLSKYASYNKNYKYIFVMIDIFSRKTYAIPLKNKSMNDTSKALDKIIVENKLQPITILSDNDASFEGVEFQKVLDKYKIYHDENIVNDHKALAIIDRFARTLKTIFTRLFLRTKSKNWIDNLNKVIHVYNKSPHGALNDISPDDADDPENKNNIYMMNVDKNKKNDPTSDLNAGDNVRIKIDGIFRKGTEPTYSDEVYKVLSTKGKSILLDDNKKYKREKLLLVPKDANTEYKNIIKEVNKDERIKRRLKKEGIEDYLKAPKKKK